MWNFHMFNCSDVNMTFCYAVADSVAAIRLKTISDAKADFFTRHIFKMKIVGDFRWWFENDNGDLQYGKVLSITFCSRFLISNDFLPRNGKTQTNSFFGRI